MGDVLPNPPHSGKGEFHPKTPHPWSATFGGSLEKHGTARMQDVFDLASFSARFTCDGGAHQDGVP